MPTEKIRALARRSPDRSEGNRPWPTCMNDPSASQTGDPIDVRVGQWPVGVCVRAAWAMALLMLACLLLRIFWHDGNIVLVAVNAFTLYFYLPAYACLAVAVWLRRRWLAAVSLLIIACHLAWIGPESLPFQRRVEPASPTAGPAPTLRIFYANVKALNTRYDAMLEEIAAADPDFIFLNEFTSSWENTFAASPVMASYLERHGLPRHRIGTMGFYTRLPVSDFKILWNHFRMDCTFDVDLNGRKLRMFCLHGPRPLSFSQSDYYRYWSETMRLLTQQPHPLLVIGDFNATPYSRAYQRVISAGLHPAHADVGRMYASSWPNGYFPLPPIRIDHALLSPQVVCREIVEGRGTGSDHKPLILEVELRDDL
jgi:endonuclease/exonuclease/phosphatase (EEP) superfamily protein YafD